MNYSRVFRSRSILRRAPWDIWIKCFEKVNHIEKSKMLITFKTDNKIYLNSSIIIPREHHNYLPNHHKLTTTLARGNSRFICITRIHSTNRNHHYPWQIGLHGSWQWSHLYWTNLSHLKKPLKMTLWCCKGNLSERSI